MRLTAIVAMTPERVIGKEGQLPWHLPDDLKFFKEQTSGHPIVMGRKTFDSIGKPLPKRQNIILTRDQNWKQEGAVTIHHPENLHELTLTDPHVFVIGGSEIYRCFLPILDDILITHILKPYDGDTQFPEYEAEFPKSELILEHDEFQIRRHFRST